MKFTPLRTALIYLCFAILWIYTTDTILESLVDDVALLTQMQIAKGLFYVILTAGGLYLMMRSYEHYIKEEKQQRAGTKANLRVALKAANMGAWNYDAKKEKLYASDKIKSYWGLPRVKTLQHPRCWMLL